jgi:tRNA dimethylallyltransferase
VNRVVVILGATAVGKSALGLRLATALDGEIVNGDALQVYRGFDIGTAKPSAAERQRVPHHLIDIVEPSAVFSAGEYARRARLAIAEIQARGKVALLVGGSGLYLRALLEGLAPMPAADPRVRAELLRRRQHEGLAALYDQLARLDPLAVEKVMPNDAQRILRALEVVLATGVPLSSWQRRLPFGSARLAAVRIGLTLPRSVLYDRIATRVHAMVARGWQQEVRGLLAAGVHPDAPAFQALGYREFARYASGEVTAEWAIEQTVRASRRYAKRQETWWRREADVTWFDASDLDGAASAALEFLGGFGFRRV